MKILIIDDEPLAREGIALLLEKEPATEVIGFCKNGDEALVKIPKLQPDLIFLDINMPGLNGLDVIRALSPEQMPLVIFLTAYDSYAIEAFKLNALDYLLKPVTVERFQQSLERAKLALQEQGIAAQHLKLTHLLETLHSDKQNGSSEQRLMVRSSNQVFFLKPNEIMWIKAEGDYVNIHTSERYHLTRETMKNMETKLDEKQFQRIHRSSIVNINFINAIKGNDSDGYQVILNNNSTLCLSKNYRETLYKKLQNNS